MIRVLHLARVINRYDFIDTIVRFLAPQHFRAAVCTFDGASTIETPAYEAAGIAHWRLGGFTRAGLPRSVVRLARILRHERTDVLHTHHYEEAVIGTLAARLARTPAVVIGRHYHDELYLGTRGLKRRVLLAGEALANGLARRIVVPSTPIRSLLVERQHVPASKIRVIPYGFDFSAERYQLAGDSARLLARRQLGLEDAFVIGNFGRHHALKGQDYLLRAFAAVGDAFPAARLVMVGDGPYHATLRTLADDLGIASRVVFTGWRTDAARIMSAVDVVAHPSLLDSFPQVMIEALVLAKPLIATDAAGPVDQLEDGRTALLVPMRDVDALAGALRRVVADPEEARRLGARGRAYVLEELDIRKVIAAHDAHYRELLAARMPGGVLVSSA